jgi:purine-nucleoside phosphorylase
VKRTVCGEGAFHAPYKMRRITEYTELQAIARERSPRVALVLGSGLSDLADRLDDVAELPFGSIAGMDAPSVAGHRGALLLGTWASVPVLVFAGRMHYYEGHPWRSVVQPIYLARELGASILVTTNAVGGIRDDLQPGDLMAIRAHLDCTREHWWRVSTSPERKRRVDADPVACAPGWLEDPYSPRWLELLQLPTGAYAQLTGPCYETPAEIRALRVLGADAVGMSTAREIQAGHDLGMECAAISCITNKAAGLGGGPIHHDEVLETGRRVKGNLVGLLETFIRLTSQSSGESA